MDVLSALVTLLDRRELHITGRGEIIKAAPGFHLFATQSIKTLSSDAMPMPAGTCTCNCIYSCICPYIYIVSIFVCGPFIILL